VLPSSLFLKVSREAADQFPMRILKEFAVQNRLEGLVTWFVAQVKL
jgi:hypothetical protein